MSMLLILASVIWGVNIIVMKVIMESVPMYLVASIRVLCSSLILGAFLYIKKQSFKVSIAQLWIILCISFFNVGLNFYLSFTGIHLLKGSSTALINALTPLATCLFSYFLLKQSMNKRTMFGVLLSVIGFLISIQFNIFRLTVGSWFLLASIISYSLSIILIKKIGKDISTLLLSFYSLLVGSLQLGVISYIQEGLPITLVYSLSTFDVLLFFCFSICGFAYIQTIHLRAIDTLGPLKTSFYLNLNPIFTYLTAIFFLKEKIDGVQIIGFIIILTSLLITKE
jgi:drug/metabolite transporter (DMT)-like permease